MPKVNKKEEKKQGSMLYVWQSAIKWTNDEEKNIIIEWCKNNCKKWVFQKEKGEEKGYIHWQIKISLAGKQRAATLSENFIIKGQKWLPSSLNGMHSFSYVMKQTTRMLGPWSDKDEEDMIITSDMEKVMRTPKKCQTELESFIDNYTMDTRVHLIIDPVGQVGKSSWAKFMQFKKKAIYVPLMSDSGKMMNYLANRPFYGCYILDIARNTNRSKYKDMWTAVENIKAGMIWDWRYKSTNKMISPPCVIITCNENMDGLSNGRLMKWLIYNNELYEFDKDKYNMLVTQHKTIKTQSDTFFFKKKFNS